MALTIISKNGREIYLDICESKQLNSLYAFAPHKCGSVLLQNILKEMCCEAGFPFLNIHSELFLKGENEADFIDSIAEILKKPGYCFGALRGPDQIDVPTITAHKKIFLLRDPRDAIVSFYFSMKKSHSPPGDGPAREAFLAKRAHIDSLNIDEFVQQGNGLFIFENMRTFLEWSKSLPNSTLFRYEDIVFEKRAWVNSIAEIFNLKVSTPKLNEIADKYDIIPSEEKPNEHIRQVKPGNYKKHLSKRSIEYIEDNFGDLIIGLSY